MFNAILIFNIPFSITSSEAKMYLDSKGWIEFWCCNVFRGQLLRSLLELLLTATHKVYVNAMYGRFFCTVLDAIVNLYQVIRSMKCEDDESRRVMDQVAESFNLLLPKIGEAVKKNLLKASSWKFRCNMTDALLEIKVYFSIN